MFNKNKYMKNKIFVDIDKIKATAPEDKLMDVPYTIPLKYQYRPDLIAYALYNDISMQDYLAIINDIDDAPEGFYAGRQIKVLKPEYKSIL